LLKRVSLDLTVVGIGDLPLQKSVESQQVIVRDLPSGLYWLQWTGEGAVKAVEKFIRW